MDSHKQNAKGVTKKKRHGAGSLKRQMQKRAKRNRGKVKKMHKQFIGETPWLDRLKAWGSAHLSHTSDLVLQKMIERGYRHPQRISECGRTSASELCSVGVAIKVEEYIIISKKLRVLGIINPKK